jgi:hypothetical protein
MAAAGRRRGPPWPATAGRRGSPRLRLGGGARQGGKEA